MMDGVTYTLTCDQFPLQFEGVVDGDAYYFRARHGDWTFGIPSNPADSPVSVGIGDAEGFVCDGEYDDADWIEQAEGIALIDQCATEYRQWKRRAECQ